MQRNSLLSLLIVLALSFFVSPVAADSHDSAESTLKIEKAVVCRGVSQRVPRGIGNVFTSDTGALFCFTKITGAAHNTMITHRWSLNGDLKSSVDLPVESSSWRTWSTKKIGSADIGDWMVEIVSEDGIVLTTIIFFVQ